MTYLVVTDLGIQATRHAEQNGFKVEITEFAVAESPDAVLAITDTQMASTPVYRGRIDTVEAVGISTVKFTVSLPANVPASGSWSLREFAIFLSSGEMFAHGLLQNPIQKTGDFGVQFYVLVTVARLGEVIDVTVGQLASIPSTPHVRSLIAPFESQQDVVVVLDSHTQPDGMGTSAPGLAVRYGAGSLTWGFEGYKRHTLDYPTRVINAGSFQYEIETKGGFWLNDNETVIVQITLGPGQGESRKMSFKKATNIFTTVDTPFTDFDVTSRIAIWRDEAIKLPTVYPDTPPYYVLGPGEATWRANVTQNLAGTLASHRAVFRVPGATFDVSSRFTQSFLDSVPKNHQWLFSDGVLLDGVAWDRVGTVITSTVPATMRYEFLIFEFIPGSGGSLYFYESGYIGDGVTDSWDLPAVPESAANVLVFIDHALRPFDHYTLQGSKITLNPGVPTAALGKPVYLVPFLQYDELGTRGDLTKDTFTTTAGQTAFVCSSAFGLRKDTIMTRNGSYVSKGKYTVSGNTLTFNNPNAPMTTGETIHIYNFAGYPEAVTKNPTGRKTGPKWINLADAIGGSLVTREEIASNYMPLVGPYVKFDNLSDKLKSILACPMLKMLDMITGSTQSHVTNALATPDDILLFTKYGAAPFTLTSKTDLIPVLNFVAIGSSVMFDIPVQVNLFTLLEKELNTQLGISDFSINAWERNSKFRITDVGDSKIVIDAKSQDQIPGAPLDTAWIVGSITGNAGYANTTFSSMATNGSVYWGQIVVLSTDCEWWMKKIQNYGVDMNGADYSHITFDNPALHTVSVTSTQDSTYIHYVHTIRDTAHTGGDTTWTVKLRRLIIVTDHNSQFIHTEDAGGAPAYVELFARIYASLKYNDADIRRVIWAINRPTTTWASNVVRTEAYFWVAFSYKCRNFNIDGWGDPDPEKPMATHYDITQGASQIITGKQGTYPATAPYTKGIAYGVRVTDVNNATGSAKVTVSITNGSISYSQFGVDLLVNKITLPTVFNVNPAIHVDEQGVISPLVRNKDIFDSCCWDSSILSRTPDCTAEPVVTPITGQPSVTIDTISVTDTQPITITVLDVPNGSIVTLVSSDAPLTSIKVGNSPPTTLTYTTIPGGIPRVVTYSAYYNGILIGSVHVTVVASGASTPSTIPTNVTFSTTSQWTVPAGITKLTASCQGAGGGGGGGDNVNGGLGGGAGQLVTADITVTPGDVLTIEIGDPGAGAPGIIKNSILPLSGNRGGVTRIKDSHGNVLLVAAGGYGGSDSGHAGAGTKGTSSTLGIGGLGGNQGAIISGIYAPAHNGAPATGYGAGGGGGGASNAPIVNSIPGGAGGTGSKGFAKLSYLAG